MIAERLLMGLRIGGIALGCSLVLYPFFSAVLWAAILVYTTWPVFSWIRHNLRLPNSVAALVMVLLSALVIVLPLGLAIPGGAADVKTLRLSLEAWMAAVPPAPHWLYSVPLAGGELTDTWNAWAADLSSMTAFFTPYLGTFAERGLSLLLSVAGGLVQFFVALFVAFFLWFSGEKIGLRLQALVNRIAGRYGPHLLATTTRAVRGTVYGILGTAIIQGFLTAFGLSLAGVPRVVLLGTVTAFLAVLPVGAPLIWIPAGLWRGGRVGVRPRHTPVFHRARGEDSVPADGAGRAGGRAGVWCAGNFPGARPARRGLDADPGICPHGRGFGRRSLPTVTR